MHSVWAESIKKGGGGFKRESREFASIYIYCCCCCWCSDGIKEKRRKEKKRSDWNRPFSSSVLLARLFIARPSSININGVCPLWKNSWLMLRVCCVSLSTSMCIALWNIFYIQLCSSFFLLLLSSSDFYSPFSVCLYFFQKEEEEEGGINWWGRRRIKRKERKKGKPIFNDGRAREPTTTTTRESENGSLIIYYSGRSWQTHTQSTPFSLLFKHAHTQGVGRGFWWGES